MELATDTAAVPEAREAEFDAAAISGVVSLRKEISQLIAPWRHSAKKPPFTAAEMAVFAMISSDKHHRSRKDVHVLSVEEMHASILRTFSYYNELAITGFAYYSAVQRQEDRVILDEVVEGFPEELQDFDLPVTKILVRCPRYRTYCEYGIAPNAARVYLRRWLEPVREGTFRFFDLSPELRNKIYEMVLHFTDAGINSSGDKDFQLIRAGQKYHKAVDPYTEWHWDRFDTNQLSSDLLPLLRTCKKIHQESSSVFYGVNYIRFHILKSLHLANLAMSSRVQKQMQCLHICLGTDHKTFKYLDLVGNMLHHFVPKRLRFTFDNVDWFMRYNQNRRYIHNGTGQSSGEGSEKIDTFEMVEELRPFVDLARRAENIEIFEKYGTAFGEFVMSQLAAQHTSSAATKAGNWVHRVLEASKTF